MEIGISAVVPAAFFFLCWSTVRLAAFEGWSQPWERLLLLSHWHLIQKMCLPLGPLQMPTVTLCRLLGLMNMVIITEIWNKQLISYLTTKTRQVGSCVFFLLCSHPLLTTQHKHHNMEREHSKVKIINHSPYCMAELMDLREARKQKTQIIDWSTARRGGKMDKVSLC